MSGVPVNLAPAQRLPTAQFHKRSFAYPIRWGGRRERAFVTPAPCAASASGTRPRPKQPPTPGNATTTQPSHNSIPAPATNHQPSRKALRLRHRGSPATQPPQHRPTTGSRHPRLGQRLEHPPKTLHLDQRRRRDLRIPRTTIKPNLRRGTLVVSLPSLLDADQQLAYRA